MLDRVTFKSEIYRFLNGLQLSPVSLRQDLVFLKRKAAFYSGRVSIALGAKGGQRDFTRFIILCSARSGSNYLRSLLNSHSRALAFGELFQNPVRISWHLPGYLALPRQLRLYRQDPRAFIDNVVFGPVPDCIAAVGFKIFYEHTGPVDRSHVWRCLLADRSLKVIHLKRRNKLEQMLSLQKALQTGQWFTRSPHRIQDTSVHLDANACRKWFETANANERIFDVLFAKHDIHEILYEDLCADPVKTMDAVQVFLEVERESLLARTQKQARQMPSQVISNYLDLKEQFSGSPWEACFHEYPSRQGRAKGLKP